MDRRQIEAILDDSSQYDESREDSLRQWFRDGFSRRMRWVALGVNLGYCLCLVPAVLAAIWFFCTDDTRIQILCAVVFLFCSHWIGFLSVFAWVMMQRPRLHREIKRLELRIAEATEWIEGQTH